MILFSNYLRIVEKEARCLVFLIYLYDFTYIYFLFYLFIIYLKISNK